MKKYFWPLPAILMCLLCISSLCAQEAVHYYFRTMDIQDGLSQNTVNQILQDRTGFIWIATKEGLNRYDGLSFRVYKKENSGLGRNFITALHEDANGDIWIGTDGGVYIYHPESDSFEAFHVVSDRGTIINNYITLITEDEAGNIWISVETQGLFCYTAPVSSADGAGQGRRERLLLSHLPDPSLPNITRFWFDGDRCWLALYADNLYCTVSDFSQPLQPFRDMDGQEWFRGDIINWQLEGPNNCVYVASMNGLTEINRTTGKVRRLLTAYVRTLQFRGDELWAGAESGLYICRPATGQVTRLSVPAQDDPYALPDNAIYSLCRDNEEGMWIGSYFGGITYYPHQWTYFEKFYPAGELNYFGRRVREMCEGADGRLWIGTEDRGLFSLDPDNGRITPFDHPLIYKNVHALCPDGDELWVGTFSGGLNRVNLRGGQVKHYGKGDESNTMPANDAFSIWRTTAGDIWIGTTSGLVRYNRTTDDFYRVPQLENLFVYDILEDRSGRLWVATFSNGVFCYDAGSDRWRHYVNAEGDPASLSYNKVISICEDSRRRLWLLTLGGGFCRYLPATDSFERYGMEDGFPGNTFYKMVDDERGNLWLTTNSGLVRFNPDTGRKRVYTTANGLLSNQFNFQSGFRDRQGRIYLGSIKGLITFRPETFRENDFVPPVVITGFYLWGKRQQAGVPGSPLRKDINETERIELKADQNSFALQVAALSYQAPELNRLEYRLEGDDGEWHAVGPGARINYSNLPYGSYTLHIRGSNSDGRWNPQERVLHIRILPPFYLSVWAKAVYLLLAAGLAIGIMMGVRRRAQQKQQRAMEAFEREKERELYRAKIDFFTNVAHEIRTPLTLIKSPLENVLAAGHFEPEVKDDLEIMDLNTNRLLDLVNQLLDFRKTETRGFRLNFVEVDVADLLQKTYKRFRPLARQRGLALEVEAPGRLYASADKEALTKILSNLLTNAVKYAGSYIRICLSVKEDRMLLRVCNDGTPVPASMREEIFKPFMQYKTAENATVSGTGIGLALARSLAELHEGSLGMEGPADVNCFLLSLPLKHERTMPIGQPHEPAEEVKPAGGEPLRTAEAAGSSERFTVLVVEDNAEMLSFVARQLGTDYRVLTAANGVEALRVLGEQTVQLVVSDVMMPEMDGLELCERLKSELEYSHIPVILLTAKTTLQAKIEGMKQGADAYVEKPFSVEYLKVCVSNLLRNREKLRTAFAHSPFVQAGSMALTKADEAFLKTLNEVVVENMQNPDFSLDEMASLLNMSRSTLNRKIKGVLDMTPNDYIRLERLKRAAQLLKEGEMQVNEVCYMTGFNTPSYFTKCFQKQFGVLPKEVVKGGEGPQQNKKGE